MEIWYILIFNVWIRIRMIILLSYYKVWQCNFAGFFDIFRITKCGKVILLQSVTDCYYKVRQVLQSVTDCYYKVRQVLQSATVITKWDVTPEVFCKKGVLRNFAKLTRKNLCRRLFFFLNIPSIWRYPVKSCLIWNIVTFVNNNNVINFVYCFNTSTFFN